MRSSGYALVLWALIAAAILSPTASADYRSNSTRWKKSPAMGAEWDDGLNKGAQVWDNVWYQSHDFIRVSDSSWHIFEYPGLHDGAHGIFGVTTWSGGATYIKYDSQENWLVNTTVPCPGNALDFWSVAAHENGHALVIDDKYDPAYYSTTMGGSYAYGLDWKRSLEAQDRTWIQNLYPCPSCTGF